MDWFDMLVNPLRPSQNDVLNTSRFKGLEINHTKIIKIIKETKMEA